MSNFSSVVGLQIFLCNYSKCLDFIVDIAQYDSNVKASWMSVVQKI